MLIHLQPVYNLKSGPSFRTYVLQEEEEVRRENQWWVKLYSMRAFLCLLCLAIRHKMFEHSTHDCNVWGVQGVRVMGGGPRRKLEVDTACVFASGLLRACPDPSACSLVCVRGIISGIVVCC